MVNFRQFVIAFIVIGLFMFSMFSFATQIQSQNNASQPLVDDPYFNSTFGQIETELENSQVVAQGQREAFEGQEPGTGGFTFDLTTIISAGTKFFSFLAGSTGLIALIFSTASRTLGINPIILTVLMGSILLTAVFLGWKYIRTGE